MIHHCVMQIFVGNFLIVLGRDHHGVDGCGAAIAVFDADLGFSVGAKEINFLGLTDFSEALRQAVGQLDGHGHEFFGFVASKTKHQALVARATGIDAHWQYPATGVYAAHDRAGIAIVAVGGIVVADAANRLSRTKLS